MSSEKLPPVVAALAERVRRAGYVGLANMMRGSVDEIMAIIAAHQPPDKLDELLAAMREFNVARRPNDSKAGILMWDDGSGQTVLPNMISFAVDTSSIGKAQWFDGKPGSAPAAIRAATERLKPKPPAPEPIPAPEAPPLDCDGCGVCCLHMAVPPYDDDERDLLQKYRPEFYAEFLAVEATRKLQLRVTGLDTVPCAFFDITTRKCRHYEHRPDVCIQFEVGGESCLAQRHAAGLGVVQEPELPHVWRVPDATTPVDTWVWHWKDGWQHGHFAGIVLCYATVWAEGCTSWTVGIHRLQHLRGRVVLADPAHPDQAPPADWTPDGEN